MRFQRFSLGTTSNADYGRRRAQVIGEFVTDRYGIDRWEIEERMLNGYLDELVLCLVVPKGKSLRGLSTFITFYRLGYDAGYAEGNETGFEAGQHNILEAQSEYPQL